MSKQKLTAEQCANKVAQNCGDELSKFDRQRGERYLRRLSEGKQVKFANRQLEEQQRLFDAAEKKEQRQIRHKRIKQAEERLVQAGKEMQKVAAASRQASIDEHSA